MGVNAEKRRVGNAGLRGRGVSSLLSLRPIGIANIRKDPMPCTSTVELSAPGFRLAEKRGRERERDSGGRAFVPLCPRVYASVTRLCIKAAAKLPARVGTGGRERQGKGSSA